MTAKYIFLLSFILALLILPVFNKSVMAKEAVVAQDQSLYDIKINSLTGQELDLKAFKNKVILIVNVASKCGFTSQYEGLEALYQRYKDDGLVILGVPSNDFGNQEPGSATDIQSFCRVNYGVTFPMTEKVKVKGDDKHSLYQFLTETNPDHKATVRWNFTKFLIDKNGRVVDSFSPMTKPLSKKITKAIKKLRDA